MHSITLSVCSVPKFFSPRHRCLRCQPTHMAGTSLEQPCVCAFGLLTCASLFFSSFFVRCDCIGTIRSMKPAMQEYFAAHPEYENRVRWVFTDLSKSDGWDDAVAGVLCLGSRCMIREEDLYCVSLFFFFCMIGWIRIQVVEMFIWSKIWVGCRAVLHIASPYFNVNGSSAETGLFILWWKERKRFQTMRRLCMPCFYSVGNDQRRSCSAGSRRNTICSGCLSEGASHWACDCHQLVSHHYG